MAPVPKRRKRELPLNQFKKYGSAFGEYEERALKIHIKGTNDVSRVFPEYSNLDTDSDLAHLRLEGFDYDRVLAYGRPSARDGLGEGQLRFIGRLREVLLRDSMSEISECYFKQTVLLMVDALLSECKLDDCLHLDVQPSMLRLKVGNEEFATLSDRDGGSVEGGSVEGRRVVWVLQESKHKCDIRYKNGEIQLVSALIAACQQNYSRFSASIFPQVMYGINVKSELVSILRAELSQEYVVSLFRGLPEQVLRVTRYPSKAGLRLSCPESRTKILSLMTKLRKHALSVVIPSDAEEESDDYEE